MSRSAKEGAMGRFVLVLFCLPVVAGCSGGGRSVLYVLPDGYRGCFWVIHDPAAPDLPKGGSRWHRVVVPAGGVVRASSLVPLDAWHESAAEIGATRTGADLEVGKTIV